MRARTRMPDRAGRAEGWRVLASDTVADHGAFRVVRDRVRSPSTGTESEVMIVRPRDWLQVVPIAADGRLVMVRQYRHGSRQTGLEVPGGAEEPDDASPAHGAARELAEETGYGTACLIPLGGLWSQPGLLGNRVRFFLALDATPRAAPAPDADEDIRVELVDPAALPAMISDGTIHNAMTIAALALAQAAGHLSLAAPPAASQERPPLVPWRGVRRPAPPPWPRSRPWRRGP